MIAKLHNALSNVRIHQASTRVTAIGDKFLHLAQQTWLSAFDGFLKNFTYEADGVFYNGELNGEAGCRYKYLLATSTKRWSIGLPPIYSLNQKEFLLQLEELRKNTCSLVLNAESVTNRKDLLEREVISTDMFIVIPKQATDTSYQQSFSIKYFLEKLLEHLIINNFNYSDVVEVPQFLNLNDTNNFAGEFLIYKGKLTWNVV
jgi:hypothetical protein